ncbi:tdpoz2 [Trichonephila clavata]|uniref:Tdpoz2 n=1 Tax=Trichonephila clavata TaxID=2740835 RepID=A0A8X6F5Z6_TRICU|nr:tdpoz2 [Trichonephila clavata]
MFRWTVDERGRKMSPITITEDKCFTYTWKVKNFSFWCQRNCDTISSPDFFVQAKGMTKWRLQLCLKDGYRSDLDDDFISFYLERMESSRRPVYVPVFFDLAFLAIDGSVLVIEGVFKKSFAENERWGTDLFLKREEVFERKGYLPGDVLTARCRMWNSFERIERNVHCFARTRVIVERRTFVWNIKLFSSFQTSKYYINSSSEGNSILTLKLLPVETEMDETYINLELSASDPNFKFLTLRLYLVDISENKVQCLREEFVFIDDDQFICPSICTLTYSKEKLVENRNLYLPNDVLKLYCECEFTNGKMSQEIEKISSGCPPLMQEGNLGSDDFGFASLDSMRTLKANLESSYNESVLCDVELKTKTSTFPAHKYILSARSPVFKAMFTNDMKEKSTGCVYIEDLTDDTIRRMLQYIYTATVTVQDLQWESACRLYAAADKYEILSLKSKCSSFLKDNLSLDNDCQIWALSDMHQDQSLKSTVQDYMLNHRGFFNNEGNLSLKTSFRRDGMYFETF